MDGIVILGIIVAGALIIGATKQDVSGMSDSEVSAENIRRGVREGWYTAVLTRVNGQAAVRLTGKTTNGKTRSYLYPIAEIDYSMLQQDGIPEER